MIRDLEDVDQELRLVVACRATSREFGGRPSMVHVDELLDERIRLAQ